MPLLGNPVANGLRRLERTITAPTSAWCDDGAEWNSYAVRRTKPGKQNVRLWGPQRDRHQRECFPLLT